jgi:hypothetical protein
MCRMLLVDYSWLFLASSIGPGGRIRAAEAKMLDRAETLTPPGLRAAIARAVMEVAPGKAQHAAGYLDRSRLPTPRSCGASTRVYKPSSSASQVSLSGNGLMVSMA